MKKLYLLICSVFTIAVFGQNYDYTLYHPSNSQLLIIPYVVIAKGAHSEHTLSRASTPPSPDPLTEDPFVSASTARR